MGTSDSDGGKAWMSYDEAVKFWEKRKEAYGRIRKHRTLTKRKREEVYDKSVGSDGYHHCWYCGCRLEYGDMQVDHFVPISEEVESYDYRESLLRMDEEQAARDAKDDISNLVPACALCNRYKSDSYADDFKKSIIHTAEIVRKRRKPANWDADKIYHRYHLEDADISKCRIEFWYERNGKDNAPKDSRGDRKQ